MQVSQAKSSCSEALQELKNWMKPEKVITKNKLLLCTLGVHFYALNQLTSDTLSL